MITLRAPFRPIVKVKPYNPKPQLIRIRFRAVGSKFEEADELHGFMSSVPKTTHWSSIDL